MSNQVTTLPVSSTAFVPVNPVSAVPASENSDVATFLDQMQGFTVPVITFLTSMPVDFLQTAMYLALDTVPRETWPVRDCDDQETWGKVIRLAVETIAGRGVPTIRSWEHQIFSDTVEDWDEERWERAIALSDVIIGSRHSLVID